MDRQVIVPYIGATPGADANTYNLFSTVVSFPAAKFCAMNGLYRLKITINNPAGGTLKGYRSNDGAQGAGIARGTNWTQIYQSALLVASTVTAMNTFDIAMGDYADFKLDWLNANVAQTGWTIDMALLPFQQPSV